LGMVKAMVVMGKNGEGDTLTSPTIIYQYDLHNWKNNAKPVYSHIKTRETHGDPDTNWMKSYTYTSGLGQEVQTKVQAEDGLAWKINNGEPTQIETTDRWVATGRTILNNKGKAVKQYEPWFSTTPDYEPETELTEYGVTPILHYDPLTRNIKTDFPDGTFTKVEFTPWEQKSYDQNDNVLASQWYTDRSPSSTASAEDKRAAQITIPHNNTPQTQYFDSMGRVFIIEDDNGTFGKYRVHNTLDIAGRPTQVTDAKERAMTHHFYAYKQPLSTQNIDSGKRWMVGDVAGKPIRAWDERGHSFRNTYDILQRPLEMFVTEDNTEKIVQKQVYGSDASVNNVGQIEKIQDQSGETRIIEYDFKGNPLTSEKQYCEDYQNDIDWSQNPTLQEETFNQAIEYDALNRPTLLTQPDDSNIKYTYNKGAMLEKVDVQHLGQGNYQSYVCNINYNEKGQRTDIYYGNNSKTKYEYDYKTFRVTRILTTRNTGIDILQNIYYFYDSIGNITEMRDDAQQIHYFDNAVIAPTGRYEYDPLYRLLKAEGRELSSLNAPDSNDFANGIPVPNPSANAMQNYTQLFVYDELGNIQNMSSQNRWTRTYNYNNTTNNYLRSTQVGQDVFSYTYDVHGNMTSMPHLPQMRWDFADRLRRVQLNLSGDTAYYIYDSTGNRCRKVVEKGSVREERYYVDGYEVFRKFISGDLDFERESLNVLSVKIAQKEQDEEKESQTTYEIDHNNKIVNIETKTIENGQPIQNPVANIRYQYSNHLGSACLELDDSANIISYEEYHPFGTTSYRSGRTETEVSLKRYKYVGKERDEETGLYYYGARYYAAWLCRFVSVDPLQFKYPELTPYQYASNNPITLIDIDGLEGVVKLLVNFLSRFIKGKNLIFASTNNKEEGEHKSTESFKKFGFNLKKEYLSNQKNNSKPSVSFVNSGNDIVKYINLQKKNTIKTLDIIAHSSQEGIFFKESKNGDKNNLYTSLQLQFKNNALFKGNSNNLSNINFNNFTIDAIVELHGCATAGYMDDKKGPMFTDDNFAIEFSKKLYSAGKKFGVVIAHFHKSGPDNENNDYRQNTRVVYYNGKVLFTTTQKGAISQEQIMSAIIKLKTESNNQ
ncbi:MAG: RHS repeat-associated core domain-containing protein, partial [Bacteroidota bacterium]